MKLQDRGFLILFRVEYLDFISISDKNTASHKCIEQNGRSMFQRESISTIRKLWFIIERSLESEPRCFGQCPRSWPTRELHTVLHTGFRTQAAAKPYVIQCSQPGHTTLATDFTLNLLCIQKYFTVAIFFTMPYCSYATTWGLQLTVWLQFRLSISK